MDILKRYFMITVLALAMTGCYSDFEPSLKSDPVLCLNSLITAGEPMDVAVSHTWRYSDGYPGRDFDVNVNDAKVSMYINGDFAGSLIFDDESGRYHGSVIPVEGDIVRLVAESEIYGHAEAEVRIPDKTPIGNVKWNAGNVNCWRDELGVGGSRDFMYMTLDIEIPVHDTPCVDNYFKFDWSTFVPDVGDGGDALINSPVEFYLSGLKYDAEPLFSEHISVFESVFGSDSYGFTAFTDRRFKGGVYPLNIRFDNGYIVVSNPSNDDRLYHLGVTLSLESISPGYYNWLIYRWNTDEGVLGTLAEIGFAEGFCGYSNVSTGAGVVAARSVSTYRLDLYDFMKQQFDEYNFKIE